MRPIAIEQNNSTGEVSYWQGRDHQSHADRDGVSLAAYIHAIHGFLIQAGAKNVLMIGAAGGTLATMLRKPRRASRGKQTDSVTVTLVDINPRAFAIAREYFHLPDEVACHVADGVVFLRRHRGRYDAIVLDAFDDDKIPPPFWTRRFFALAKKRLKRGGLFAVNITVQDDDDDTPDRFCKWMKTAWRDVRLLDTDGYIDRNAVAVAGRVAGLKPPRLTLRPRRKAKQIAKELRGLTFRRLR